MEKTKAKHEAGTINGKIEEIPPTAVQPRSWLIFNGILCEPIKTL